jgi:bla regulator protein blaR1
MIPTSEMWAEFAPALGNHLWQSTLVAITAGIIALLLRTNQARARYGLWLVASLKFLIPFSLLVGVGSHVARIQRPVGTRAQLYLVMNEVTQPFRQPTAPLSSTLLASTGAARPFQYLPTLLAGVWLVGFMLVLSAWYGRCRSISAVIRRALPLHQGREVDVLRRMERSAGIERRIQILLSPTSLEPQIFGIARPILLWPEGISEHLGDAHLEAIVAHEVWHVRRNDNLAAALHMVVEAIFWFHPLVWWLGARLLDERERACDEGVLEFGSERQVYAESILKTCEFCVGSELACVSGVTGADLKKRIVQIMTQRVTGELNFSKKLMLGATGLVAIALPITFGLLTAASGRAQSQAAGLVSAADSSGALHTSGDKAAGRAVPAVSKLVSPKTKACSKSARAHNPRSQKSTPERDR